MFRICVYLIGLSFSLFVLAGTASAELRCGNRLVHIEESKSDVVRKCGEPAFVDSWVEERVTSAYPIPDGYDIYRYPPYYYQPYLTKEYVQIDKWTYNFGSTRFQRYLFFENGVLKKIEVGEYGY